MIWAVIFSGFAWLVGNVIWDKFGLNEPKLFYVPLAIFIVLMLFCIKKSIAQREKILHIIFGGFIFLALGNFVKQLFYTNKIKQLNDYWFGSIVVLITLILIYRQWAIQKHKVKNGGSS